MHATNRRRQLEQLLALTPNEPFLLYGLAMEFAKEGDRDTAILRLQSLIEAHPDYLATYYQLGRLLVEQGEVDGAKSALQRGIAVAQQAGDAHTTAEIQDFLAIL